MRCSAWCCRWPRISVAQAGPRCLTGPCPEGAMCCGKMAEVRDKYAKLKEEALQNG